MNFGTVFLDSHKMRLRRMRQRIRAFVDLAGDRGETGATAGKWAMLTLTYAAVDGWRPDHIAVLMKRIRDYTAFKTGESIPYVWVAELQERGAVHYHVLLKLPKGFTLPKPDKRGWWEHGSTQIAWVRKSGKRYLAKYASKANQKEKAAFPKGLRMCGAGGLPEAAKVWWRWLLCPGYVRAECQPADLPQRACGGYRIRGWRDARGVAFFLPSPWIGAGEFGGVRLSRCNPDEWLRKAQDTNPVFTYEFREAWDRMLLAGSVGGVDFSPALFHSNREGFTPGYSWDGAGFVPVSRAAAPRPAMCEKQLYAGWENWGQN